MPLISGMNLGVGLTGERGWSVGDGGGGGERGGTISLSTSLRAVGAMGFFRENSTGTTIQPGFGCPLVTPGLRRYAFPKSKADLSSHSKPELCSSEEAMTLRVGRLNFTGREIAGCAVGRNLEYTRPLSRCSTGVPLPQQDG